MTDIPWLDATTLARNIRDGELSAVEAVRAQLDQIAAVNPALNAVITLAADAALAEAERLDGEQATGPLHGVPILLKDCHETAGMRTTAGSPRLGDYVPLADGTVARRLRAAGAIVLGKTNVSAFLTDVQTTNPLFGRTNNPWNLDRIPGGSSGGAAAAVAAGLAPLDIGSDIGGSIRIPAHCCGIFGLKPTDGRVPNAGHIPDLPGDLRTTRVMNCIGPLARSIDDLELALNIIAGPDIADPDVPPVALDPAPRIDLAVTRFAIAQRFPGLPADAATQQAIAQIGLALEGAGSAVEEVLPEIDFDEQLATRAALRVIVRMRIEPPTAPPSAEEYFRLLQQRDELIGDWERFFATYDALICPVMMVPAFPHCERGTPIMVDDATESYDLLAGYCRPFNLTGHPVVTLPVGLSPDGLPIGVQVVGARWSEARLLGIARAMAEAMPQIATLRPGGV